MTAATQGRHLPESYLAMPMFVVDADGDLVYYNEPAEALLGHRYEETGQMPLVSAIPLNDPDERALGAVAIFWEG